MPRFWSQLLISGILWMAMATCHPASAQPADLATWVIAPRVQTPTTIAFDANPRLTLRHPGIRALLEDVSRRSPFLHRQLARLTSDTRLTLSIDIVPASRLRQMRAMTRLLSAGRRIHADVVLSIEVDIAELLGHEFEHVLERLDGVQLQQRYARGDTSTHPSASNAFETNRAVLAGRVVAAEYAGRAGGARP